MTGRRLCDILRYTIALNSRVQGTGADILKLALARLFENRGAVPGVKLVAAVHDEVVVEAPSESAEQAAAWLKHHMEDAMREIVGDRVPAVADVSIGLDWSGTQLA
jgi:DNA polymerase I